MRELIRQVGRKSELPSNLHLPKSALRLTELRNDLAEGFLFMLLITFPLNLSNRKERFKVISGSTKLPFKS